MRGHARTKHAQKGPQVKKHQRDSKNMKNIEESKDRKVLFPTDSREIHRLSGSAIACSHGQTFLALDFGASAWLLDSKLRVAQVLCTVCTKDCIKDCTKDCKDLKDSSWLIFVQYWCHVAGKDR